MIFTVINRITNDYEASNDILQETFIDVFTSIPHVRSETSLAGWIKRIAIRKSVRYLKNKKTYEDINQIPDVNDTSWDNDFTSEYLHRAIQSLPPGTRTVFSLLEIEGYKHREVAELLDISVSTSKSQLNYAKKLLRRKLQEFYS